MLVLLALADAVAAPGAETWSAPLRLTFDESAVPQGVWQVTVGGDLSGTATAMLKDLRIAGARADNGGELVDPSAPRFQGSIRPMRASPD